MGNGKRIVTVRRPVRFIISRVLCWPIGGLNLWLLLWAVGGWGGKVPRIDGVAAAVIGIVLGAVCELRAGVAFSDKLIVVSNSLSSREVRPDDVAQVVIGGMTSGLAGIMVPGVCFEMKGGHVVRMQASLGVDSSRREKIAAELTAWGRRNRVPVNLPTLGAKKRWQLD